MASPDQPQLVILGSSAGGIDVLSSILERTPLTIAAPIVVAQHLDPRRPSHLAEILGRRTSLEVHGVEAAIELQNGHVYILPADGGMEVVVGGLRPTGDTATRPAPSIDLILSSAAAAYGEGLTAVILSGSGSDGAAGARQVKAAGGTVVIQNPDTAAYPSMPQAISASIVDLVADAESIGPLLDELVRAPQARRDDDRGLRAFLEYVRQRGGIDFGTYKRGTILRRLQRRMLATGNDDLAAYRRYIDSNPEEFTRLTSSFLIKVTEFFRDPELFGHLRETVLPALVADAREAGRELRIWSAGCATGEEAYSLAMLAADALGDEVEPLGVRIFATDVDPDAIAYARRGTYPAAVVSGVPEDLRNRYFTRVADQFEISKRIRAMTVFGQHDLGQRAPFPRVDLAVCRNVLIYFTPDLQRRALQLFAFALRNRGFLVLGKAESTTPLPEHFVVTEPRLKVYRREGERVLIPAARRRELPGLSATRLPVAKRPGWTEPAPALRDPSRAVSLTERAEQLLLRLPVGIVVVNREYDIQLINLAARDALGIHGEAVASDLIHMLPDALAADVRRVIDGSFAGSRSAPLVAEVASVTADGEAKRSVELRAEPFRGPEDRSQVDWVLLVATDTTAATSNARAAAETAARDTGERDRALEQAQALAGSNEDLRRVNRELTTANTELRTANEELLVASEEIQAATEEVETLNEELQATNEELETMNEELQATVEELNTTNDDLEARTAELEDAAAASEELRLTSEDERRRLLAVLDLVADPVLIVDAEGGIIKASEAFRAAIGEPSTLDADGPLGVRSARGLRRRAATEEFSESVEIDGRPWTVLGRPLDGQDGPAGALVFRAGDPGEGSSPEG